MKPTLDAVFLHGCKSLESESEGIDHEYCFSSVYPMAFIHLDSYDEQYKEDQEA